MPPAGPLAGRGTGIAEARNVDGSRDAPELSLKNASMAGASAPARSRRRASTWVSRSGL